MKVKWSGVGITDGRGSFGGNFTSKNHYGAFVGTRVTPINPQSAYQQSNRSSFSNLTRTFQTLSPTQIDNWNIAALDYPRYDNVGNLYYPTGQNLYIELNQNLRLSTIPYINDAPKKSIPNSVGTFYPTADNATGVLDWTYAVPPIDTDSRILTYAAPPLSPSIRYINRQYRLIVSFSISGQAGDHIESEYITRFGLWPVGSQLAIKLVCINSITGDRSLINQASCIST